MTTGRGGNEEAKPDYASEAQQRSARRSRWLGAIAIVVFTLSAVQLFSIQIIRGPALAEQGRQVRTTALAIQAPRGNVYDSTGQVLVESVEAYHIAVNQNNILNWKNYSDSGRLIGEGPAEAARLLAPLLEEDPAELGGKMLGDSTFVYLKKNVDIETFREIRSLGIYGIEWEPNYQRLYPAGATAASVVGSVDVNGEGNSGLELVYDEVLTGVPGEESFEIGPTGAVIPGAKMVSTDAVPGGNVYTTINADLQNSVQQSLDAAVERFNADWGAIVVLEIGTSKVLALADSGLKPPAEGPQPSRAVQWVFEPGSVGKLFTVATALEQGTVTPSTVFTIPDTYEPVPDEVVTDIYPHETYLRTTAGIMTQSSNTGAVMIGETVSNEARHQTMVDFGLGSATGIELPGESAGMLADPSEWRGRDVYTTMFGQGYAMTVMQAATMASVIGNGGVWQAPRLVEGWTDSAGVYYESPVPEPHQAIQEETAEILLRMMESVTTDQEIGTGTAAAVEGYRVGVKTGTSEIATGGTVGNVVGVLPVEDPRVAIGVTIYHPRGPVLSGDTAAPLFGEVAATTMATLGVPGSVVPPELYPTTP